ncbi:MAG: ABC transporter ATP-binding protein [Acidimicrobiia bacterium]|nr:ABC transporter ATP-binding protein [Acidimicrobiia bacterium]
MSVDAPVSASPVADEPGDALMIRAREMSRVYHSGDGVHALDLSIPPGSIFGFIGPSGSGKTTTVRLCTGALAPTSGSVEVFGQPPSTFDAAMRSRIGYMPQLSVLYEDLSVKQNLAFFASLYGPTYSTKQRMSDMLEFVELSEHSAKRVSQTSGGMQRRLSLAAALVHEPDVVFLDEPTAGIDPVLRKKFWDRFRDLREAGKTLFVTTQYVGEAAYCDYVGVLADGRLIALDTPDGLRRLAFGGDVVDVEFKRLVDVELLDEMTEAINAASYDIRSPRTVRFVVDEASTALPALTSWLNDRSVELAQAEEFLPPYDDVFVELVNRFRDEDVGIAPGTSGRLQTTRPADLETS